MATIDTKNNPEVHIGVLTNGNKINLYIQDRHVCGDSYLTVSEAYEVINELQDAIDSITGGDIE